MRYQLPEGIASVSVRGLEFLADDDGRIEVQDGLAPEVYQDLESPHHHNLKGVAEPRRSPDDDQPGEAIAEKRLLRELLRHHSVILDGRATLPYLRGLVIETLEATLTPKAQDLSRVVKDVDQRPAEAIPGRGGRGRSGVKNQTEAEAEVVKANLRRADEEKTKDNEAEADAARAVKDEASARVAEADAAREAEAAQVKADAEKAESARLAAADAAKAETARLARENAPEVEAARAARARVTAKEAEEAKARADATEAEAARVAKAKDEAARVAEEHRDSPVGPVTQATGEPVQGATQTTTGPFGRAAPPAAGGSPRGSTSTGNKA